MRLACFAGVFVVLALFELLLPRRALTAQKPRRWLSNLTLVVLNTLVVRLLMPISVVGAAGLAQTYRWGLLQQLDMTTWLEIGLSLFVLDFTIYLQHVLFHALPFLWRLHRVHHADLDLDVTTGLRFHTLEILISLAIKLAVVFLLGVPALAVLIFEITLNATSLFNHSNLRLPIWLDRVLRLLVVTPDMHRVHHSVIVEETNSNYGFNLPWWDFLLGTYRAQPAAGHTEMTIGLADLRDEQRADGLPWMLALPFMKRNDTPGL